MDQNSIVTLLNQVFEVQKKIRNSALEKSLNRNLRRMWETFSEAGYRIHDPMGEPYDLTRLDCEALVSGDQVDQLIIVEVVKPVIYYISEGQPTLIQKGVVLVEQKVP